MVLVMHEFEGLQYKEIADRIGISIGTVMSRLFPRPSALGKPPRACAGNEPNSPIYPKDHEDRDLPGNSVLWMTN